MSPFPGIEAVGDTMRISLNGLGTNNAVFDAPVVAPEPGTAMLLYIGCAGGAAMRRRRSA